MKILIGSAWPYANGSLHIGHLAALLPGDVIARYYRLKGEDVYFVSGSDCHGTPVAIRAKQEGKSPQEISNYYHNEFCYCFNKLGFTYDRYGKTSSAEHTEFVSQFHKAMYDSEYVYEKETPQAFCLNCNRVLSDRFVVGRCPVCGEKARGDQCDGCGTVLDPENLYEATCAICGNKVSYKETKHLFIAISKLEQELRDYINSHNNWRKNAITFSLRYINEGLRDRAITRDLDWGIDVPKDGYENKKIYIWAENVLGYLSMSKIVADEREQSYESIWESDSIHYYVHGKDNIPFHTIILPSLMLANGEKWRLPDHIISSEYLTLEGRKISTSQNWAIWVKDIVDNYDADSIRYFFITNGPEKRDTDFSWREFINSHNGELLGGYGNFVNRTLAFIQKYFDGEVPNGKTEEELDFKIAQSYETIGKLIESGSLKEAIGTIFELVRLGNKYFDTKRPWETRTSDAQACKDAIYNCVQLIANLSVLLEPFIPFSSTKIKKWLQIDSSWGKKGVQSGLHIPQTEILFERIDKKTIEEELRKLKGIC